MSKEFFDPKTHAFLRDERLRSEYSSELLNTIGEFYSTLFKEAPPLLRQWHEEQHGVIVPFGSVLFGTAIRGISDIDEFGIFDGEMTDGERNAVGNALIGNILLGEETRMQAGKLDAVFSVMSSTSQRSPITLALLSENQIAATITDSSFSDHYSSFSALDGDSLQAIAIVTLFLIPDNLVFPNGEFTEVTKKNLRHHRLEVARKLLVSSEEDPLYGNLQSVLNKVYMNSFNRSFNKHPEGWIEFAEQVFSHRNNNDPKRAARLLAKLRRVPTSFPSPAEIVGWLSGN